MQSTEPPRGRGRPRKAATINPLFPGKVIDIASVPRLRVGSVCEIRDTRVAGNIGTRVTVTDISGDGFVSVLSQTRPIILVGADNRTPAGESWVARIHESLLYRVGFCDRWRHD